MPTPSASHRLQALSHQLASAPPSSQSQTTSQSVLKKDMATESKSPITCHVLDTTLGKPAAGIPVVLTLHGSTGDSVQAQGEVKFSGTTNGDGRVTTWTPPSTSPSSSLSTLFHSPGSQKYSLTFDTDEYFGQRGIKTFFPEVEVKFVVRAEAKGEHYHVPVLLGPFGYTTYRGS